MTFLTITLILGVVVLTWLGWYSYSSYCEIKTTRERGLKIEKLRGTIIHLDEVLTMSARMAAATGDLRWEKRYRDFEPQLDDAIKESITFALETHSKEAATETDAANIKLVDMENGAFDLIRRGWTDEAKALLFSGEYERQKQIYAQGMTRFAQPQHRYVRLEELRSTIIHLDEVLTMSARMAAAMGDLQWEKRYRHFEPELDDAIKEAIRLVYMENGAFDLVRQGRLDEARELLFSEEYETQKGVYANGMVGFAATLSDTATSSLEQEQHDAFLQIVAAILVIPLLVTGWFIVFYAVRKWDATLRKNNRLLVEQAEDLAKLNRNLDQKVVERTADLRGANETLRREITERKQAEEALRESEKQHRILFENMLDGFAVHDMICDEKGNPVDYRFTSINPAFERMTGLIADEIVGKAVLEVIPNLEKHWIDTYGKVALTGEPVHFENYSEPLGKYFEISAYRPFPGQFACLFKDITDRKRAEEEKKKLEAQLQRAEKMEAIGTLAGGVAHDLNNILGGLVSYPEILLMDLPEDSPLRGPILTIEKSGKKAAAIVQDLLTLARRGVAVTEVASLNDILTEYLSSPEYEKLKEFHPRVQFETNLETDLLNVLASTVHISKTAMNLISNAAEALPDGGKISISTKNQYVDKPIRGYDEVKEGDYVVLTVADNGIGISAQDLDKIFEPFYTKKAMGRSGTGLGMAVVWGTVKDHKGYIDVKSIEGKGTTFNLYFPVTRIEAEKHKAALSIQEFMGNGETILVVDDVQEQREIASVLLTKLGYLPNTVSSGEEAVEYIKTNSADLVVLDMIMDPGIDGLDTYKKILEMHPGTKAVIASGFSETDRVTEAQELGAGQYIKKPYTIEKVGVAVKTELAKSKESA